LGPEDLERLARELGPRAVAVGTFHRLSAPGDARNLDAEVLAILGRRPCTALDLAGSLGLGEPDLTLLLERLEREGRVVREFHGGDYFYRRTV
jgi:DNA-binding MarR family transcriptional regulator